MLSDSDEETILINCDSEKTNIRKRYEILNGSSNLLLSMKLPITYCILFWCLLIAILLLQINKLYLIFLFAFNGFIGTFLLINTYFELEHNDQQYLQTKDELIPSITACYTQSRVGKERFIEYYEDYFDNFCYFNKNKYIDYRIIKEENIDCIVIPISFENVSKDSSLKYYDWIRIIFRILIPNRQITSGYDSIYYGVVAVEDRRIEQKISSLSLKLHEKKHFCFWNDYNYKYMLYTLFVSILFGFGIICYYHYYYLWICYWKKYNLIIHDKIFIDIEIFDEWDQTHKAMIVSGLMHLNGLILPQELVLLCTEFVEINLKHTLDKNELDYYLDEEIESAQIDLIQYPEIAYNLGNNWLPRVIIGSPPRI